MFANNVKYLHPETISLHHFSIETVKYYYYFLRMIVVLEIQIRCLTSFSKRSPTINKSWPRATRNLCHFEQGATEPKNFVSVAQIGQISEIACLLSVWRIDCRSTSECFNEPMASRRLLAPFPYPSPMTNHSIAICNISLSVLVVVNCSVRIVGTLLI